MTILTSAASVVVDARVAAALAVVLQQTAQTRVRVAVTAAHWRPLLAAVRVTVGRAHAARLTVAHAALLVAATPQRVARACRCKTHTARETFAGHVNYCG